MEKTEDFCYSAEAANKDLLKVEIANEFPEISESELSDSNEDYDNQDYAANVLDFADPDEKIFVDTLNGNSSPSFCYEPTFNQEEWETKFIRKEDGSDVDENEDSVVLDEEMDISVKKVFTSVIKKTSVSVKSSSRFEGKKKYSKRKKVYICPMCDRVFNSHSNRRAHMRVHTNEKPFTCAYCNRNFVQKSQLKCHIRIHTGEKPYSCLVCGRKFSRKGCMTVHRKTHSSEKPYSCPVCGLTTKYKTSIKKHKQVHNGEKPYVCPICNNSFSQASVLKEHMRIHTGEQHYVCSKCDYKTGRYSSLRRHERIHTRRKFTKEEIEAMITELDSD